MTKKPQMTVAQAKEVILAHHTSNMEGEERFPRAQVRTDDEGLTAITTMSGGTFKTVFFSLDEAKALVRSIEDAIHERKTTLTVHWGKDRD